MIERAFQRFEIENQLHVRSSGCLMVTVGGAAADEQGDIVRQQLPETADLPGHLGIIGGIDHAEGDGARVAGFTARRTNQADNLLTACANLNSLAPNFARDISRWLKAPKDGAELGRSWF